MTIPRALAPLLFLNAVVLGCSDVALARVALDLEVTASSEQGTAIADSEVWLVAHGLPRNAGSSKRRHLVCTTDSTGSCTGKVRYTYDVYYPPWHRPEGPLTSADDFEIAAKQGGQLRSLGFLPPLASHQVQGFETVRFSGRVQGLVASANRRAPASER